MPSINIYDTLVYILEFSFAVKEEKQKETRWDREEKREQFEHQSVGLTRLVAITCISIRNEGGGPYDDIQCGIYDSWMNQEEWDVKIGGEGDGALKRKRCEADRKQWHF